MTNTFFEHQIAYITTKITIETPSKTGVGTGFFYEAPLNNDTNRSLTLLISNKHVFFNPKGRLIVSLNCKKEDDTPEFGNVITFDQIGFEKAYFIHPDPEVDLACINVSKISRTNAFYKCLHNDLLRRIDYDRIAVGSEVIFVGYPDGRYDTVNNLPLIRKGWVASMPNIDFNGRGQIVIDAQVFQGSSGSPVFVSWDGKYSLFGVVSETMVRDSELQILQANTPQLGVEEVLGLGIVIKQRHVQELIDYAVNEHIRRTSSSS